MSLERDEPQMELQGKKSGTGRRWGIWLAVLAAAFLLGFVPMWLVVTDVNYDLRDARRELRRNQILNTLGSAVIDARRGEYESARQASSQFFTEINSEMDNATDGLFLEQEKAQIRPALVGRDDIITLLSRSDPAATERLSDLYVQYRDASRSAAPAP